MGCNGINFYESVCRHPLIQGCARSSPKWIVDYDSPLPTYMTNTPHKNNCKDSIWADCLLFDYQLCNNDLLKHGEFVFFIGNGSDCIKNITNIFYKDEGSAELYYSYRLRRLYDLMIKTKNSLVYIDGISDFDKFQKEFNDRLGLNPKLIINRPNTYLTNNGNPPEYFDKYYARFLKLNDQGVIKLI